MTSQAVSGSRGSRTAAYTPLCLSAIHRGTARRSWSIPQ